MDKTKSNDESHILIQNQHFLPENSAGITEYSARGSFPGISFVDCSFEKVFLSGTVFGSCSFQNCIFNGFYARKCTFSGCCFEDCKITDSETERMCFYDTHLKTLSLWSTN